jgi:hypothetical protein
VTAGLSCALVSACASIQPSTAVQHIDVLQQGTGSGTQLNVPQLIPVPPGPDWRPDQIVFGFLAASASFSADHKIARQYLYKVKWNPGWAATVVSTTPSVGSASPVSAHLHQPAVTVRVTGQVLAALTSHGQVLPSSGRQQQLTFGLVRTPDGWRIDRLPAAFALLLTESDFQDDYQATNLYFYAGSGVASVLVPDPVSVPLQISAQDRARGLIAALTTNPAGWLDSAATTAFPRRTSFGLLVKGTDAIVDLRGRASRLTPAVVRRVAAQLVLTLTGASYPVAGIQSVQLSVNGQPWRSGAFLYHRDYSGATPSAPSAAVAYFLAPDGAVRTLTPAGQDQGPLALPRQLPVTSLTAIAVSPGGGPRFAGCKGRSVYVSAFSRAAKVLPLAPLPGDCTSLSWDTKGDLWIAGGSQIWLAVPGSTVAKPVANGALSGPGRITDFTVAPDGTRVAMIVRSGSEASQVFVAAISREPAPQVAQSGWSVAVAPGVPNPAAVAWRSSDHLVVLSQPGTAGAQLYDVPVNGGRATALVTPQAATSVSAGPLLVVGTLGGQIWTAGGPGGQLRQVGRGYLPVYPG